MTSKLTQPDLRLNRLSTEPWLVENFDGFFFSNLNSNLHLNHNLVFWINCWSSLSSNEFPGIKTSIEPTSFFWSTAEKETFRVLIFVETFLIHFRHKSWSRDDLITFFRFEKSESTKNACKTFICTQFKRTRFDVFDLKIRIRYRKFFFRLAKYPNRML